MSRILHFTSGPTDWQPLLAQPEKQWRTGFSARTLAYCWEDGQGFPPEVAAVFKNGSEPLFADIEPILAIPEFKVPLPGGDRASQNDIFVLARSKSGPVSIMVEGKVEESFGPKLAEWQIDAAAAKDKRLSFLVRTIGLLAPPGGSIRYQLIHRAASAIIEGQRYRAAAAVLLVHSFSEQRAGWSDYKAFLKLFGVQAEVGLLQRLPGSQAVPLFSAWVEGDLQFLRS